LNALLDDLVLLAKIQAGPLQPKPIALRTVIEQTIVIIPRSGGLSSPKHVAFQDGLPKTWECAYSRKAKDMGTTSWREQSDRALHAGDLVNLRNTRRAPIFGARLLC